MADVDSVATNPQTVLELLTFNLHSMQAALSLSLKRPSTFPLQFTHVLRSMVLTLAVW